MRHAHHEVISSLNNLILTAEENINLRISKLRNLVIHFVTLIHLLKAHKTNLLIAKRRLTADQLTLSDFEQINCMHNIRIL